MLRTSIVFLLAGGLFLLNSCQSPKNHSDRVLLTNQQDSTLYYVYHIEYPDSAVAEPVADSIRNFAHHQKQMFLNNQPSDTSRYNVTPYELLVKINRVFKSPGAVSYKANVYKFTGGAHGRSVIKTYNYDLENDQFIMLHNLFQDTTALKPVSKAAEQKIIKKYYQNDGMPEMDSLDREWVNKGTAPAVKNYRRFYFAKEKNQSASGIEIIFAPYQVGPHSFGIPKIFIPDSVFYQNLSSKYKPLFSNF